MRTVRLTIAVLVLLVVMILMAANMTPVELYLAPQKFLPGLPTLKGVPVALIIIVALLTGILVGFLMEFARAAKDRRKLAEKRRELSDLRDENLKLARRL